jgi:ABC-type branched-subunit amino acid transport system substrate-binding protein
VTVGLLTDITGPAASGNKTAVHGVQAGTYYAARNGYQIKYIVGDTATSPTTTLSVAQKFVTQDHVSAVIAVSALTFAASNYLTAHGVPVVGAGQDGPEWLTAKNMFSVFGALDTTKVATTTGTFFKRQGVTNLGAIGYSVSPISSEAAKSSAASAKHAGIEIGYLNARFPFGSTNVAPVAIAMKDAGVNGFTATVDPNTSFALISALHQQNVDLKAALLASGYGGDVLESGPGTIKAAQGVFFGIGYEPVEMQTPATKQFQGDLKSAGVSGAPTVAEYNGYLSVGLLVRAFKDSGGDVSHSATIKTLSNTRDWDGLGLFGGHTVDFADRSGLAAGVDNCQWYTKLVGNSFQLVKDATPICGTLIKGVSVSPST